MRNKAIKDGRIEKTTARSVQDYFQSLESGTGATDIQSYLLSSRGELDRAIKLISALYK